MAEGGARKGLGGPCATGRSDWSKEEGLAEEEEEEEEDRREAGGGGGRRDGEEADKVGNGVEEWGVMGYSDNK